METSILTSTKKILGIGDNYTSFDLDIITHINAALAIVNQLGVIPDPGIMIEDDSKKWGDLHLPENQTNLLRTYIFLKVRVLFDPPGTGFLIDAINKQLAEYEYRLSLMREVLVQILPRKGNTYGYDDGFDSGYYAGWGAALRDSIGPN